MALNRRPFPRSEPVGLERLKERIRAIEGNAARFEDGETRDGAVQSGTKDDGTFGFGAPEIDDHLPWRGLQTGALHEVIAVDSGAATGFCAALIGRLAAPMKKAACPPRPILWCEGRHALDHGGLYGPGLARFGIDPGRLILVRARRDADILWAMEEGLRCGGPVAVVGEARAVSMTAGRRLQLAAAASGVAAFLIRPRAQAASPSAAMTRWRVEADGVEADGVGGVEADGMEADGANRADREDMREPGLGPPRWRVELFRCRGGAARAWTMEWHDETGRFAVADAVRDRPDRAQPSRLAG